MTVGGNKPIAEDQYSPIANLKLNFAAALLFVGVHFNVPSQREFLFGKSRLNYAF